MNSENLDKPNEERTRADINRENAQKSTGPVSSSGKAISSQNAVKHGVYRRLGSDDLLTINQIVRDFSRDFKPEGVSEQLAVRQMAEAWFHKLNVDKWYHGLIDTWYAEHPMQSDNPITPEASREDYAFYKANKKDIDTFDRMQERLANRYDKCFRRLRLLQKERKQEEVRLARSGVDRNTLAPVEKGKLHNLNYGVIGTAIVPTNEAILDTLKTPRKVEPPDKEENKSQNL